MITPADLYIVLGAGFAAGVSLMVAVGHGRDLLRERRRNRRRGWR